MIRQRIVLEYLHMKNHHFRPFRILLCLMLAVPLFQPVQAEENSSSAYEAETWPEITSDYAYLIDWETGQVLYDKDSDAQIYPASMTKMMTTILAIENLPDLSQTVLITEEMLAGLDEANASQAGFKAGDEPTVLDLLYGDMLPSGADCSRALAFTIAGSEEAFVEMMNQKAQELGMANTHFVNTTGLHDDSHYSTCQDIATLMKYCIQNDLFVQLISTADYTSTPVEHYPDGLGMKSTVFYYINNPEQEINFEIPGFIGGKSGFTLQGEYCLASIASFNSMNLMLITAHGMIQRGYPTASEDAWILYSYAQSYEKDSLYHAGDLIQTIPVRNSWLFQKLDVTIDQDVTLDLNPDQTHIEIDLPETLNAPVKQGDQIGSIRVYSFDQLKEDIPLYASKDISYSMPGAVLTVLRELVENYPLAGISICGLLIVLIVLLCRASHTLNRKKKAKKRR